MAVARIVCVVCGGVFHGRVDAVYCSPACRQKAHRARTARRIAALSSREAAATLTGAVAAGDAWMGGRFGDASSRPYVPLAETIADIKAQPRGAAFRNRQIHNAEREGPRMIRDYVGAVARIGRRPNPSESGAEFDTALGNALPAHLGPAEAAELANTLRAARPRVDELISLLQRRGREGQPAPDPL